jgi:stage V sporulation protein R
MELIDQHAKRIMEECKSRARDAGLRFDDETLEYVVTNRDMLELSPKNMIPTLYDYWMHDVNVLREKGKYELYPHNPYETVINSRPAISFYNDNNPDWLNVMIFYHVIGHIDFFQNNLYFRNTWNDDFVGQALADKRLLKRLRSEHGRWVDYVLEFARGIDNLVDYYHELDTAFNPPPPKSTKLDYFFDIFLQREKKVGMTRYMKELDLFNQAVADSSSYAENVFLSEAVKRYPELDSTYQKYLKQEPTKRQDVMQYVIENSQFIGKDENRWMRSVLQVVRNSSLYFQPQIRTKIINEGWASYWHDKLFIMDERVSGHETDYARVNARVTSLSRVGINPYAIGMRMISEIEMRADKGMLSYEFESIRDSRTRKEFDKKTGTGPSKLFELRENFCDFTLINTFCDQDFVDRHKLFVAGRRLNPMRQTWEYYVKSRKAEDYRAMLLDSLHHPPIITVDEEKSTDKLLIITHAFEGKPLVREYIDQVMLGLEYLWGAPVQLATTLVTEDGDKPVVFKMENQKLSQKDAK